MDELSIDLSTVIIFIQVVSNRLCIFFSFDFVFISVSIRNSLSNLYSYQPSKSIVEALVILVFTYSNDKKIKLKL